MGWIDIDDSAHSPARFSARTHSWAARAERAAAAASSVWNWGGKARPASTT